MQRQSTSTPQLFADRFEKFPELLFLVCWALNCFVTGLTFFFLSFSPIDALPRLSISPLILIALTLMMFPP